MSTDFFADFTARRAVWLDGTGPHADIVLSTRARLARNLKAFPFPHRASEVELSTVRGELLRNLRRLPVFASGWVLEIDALEPQQRLVLQEMLLADQALLAHPEQRGLMVDADLSRTALVNDVDHLRLLAYRSGLDPHGAVNTVLEMDEALDGHIAPAFAEDLGYLTTNPTDVGTGLRVSAVLHLPGLVLADEIDKVLNAMRQLQFSVQGLHGEGRAVRGALFLVANLITLGRDERETATDFAAHVGRIISYERAARDLLCERDAVGMEDLVFRALAVLTHARLVTSQETFDCLSHLRLGVQMGLLPHVNLEAVNRLLVGHQTAHLDLAAGRRLTGRERTAARAALMRDHFSR